MEQNRTQVHFRLDEGVAFVMTHKDGSRTLHVFTESGTLKVAEDVVNLYQVPAGNAGQHVFGTGGTFVAGSGSGQSGTWSSSGGGGAGARQPFFAFTVIGEGGAGGAGGAFGEDGQPGGTS